MGICGGVTAAGTRSGTTTPAAIGTARSAAATSGASGIGTGSTSCCPPSTEHIIFTLPETLSELALYNGPLIYNLLFCAASQAILHVARTWTQLQADTGFIALLHSWGQLLLLHVHLHVLWPAGGLALDGTGWRALPGGCCLPTAWLVEEFRTRFLNGLQKAYEQDKLLLRDRHGQLLAAEAFAEWLETLRTCYWNLHAKPVDRGSAGLAPAAAAERTLKYLAGYASGVALKKERLLSLDNDEVTFSYKDYRDQGRRKIARVPALEFIDRFLLHVLPRHLRHIRNYGFLSHNQRGTKLPLIRRLLGLEDAAAEEDAEELGGGQPKAEAVLHACPCCADGVLVLELALPRPSIAQIMGMTRDQLRQLPLPFG